MRYSLGFILALALFVLPRGVSAQATDTVVAPTPKPEPYTVDPELSPVGIQRWHPEAFDPALKSERELEIEYQSRTATEERKPRLSKGARIAIGVLVPVVVFGVVAGAFTATTLFSD